MTGEKKLQLEEKIMDAVCDLCHWPYAYAGDDEEVLYAEKCEHCAAAKAVADVLDAVG